MPCNQLDHGMVVLWLCCKEEFERGKRSAESDDGRLLSSLVCWQNGEAQVALQQVRLREEREVTCHRYIGFRSFSPLLVVPDSFRGFFS